jgi:LysR family transcriptional regulator of abg operon
MSIRLSQLRSFLAVVEAGSLRAGTRQAGMSQPALTRSLQQLEDELQARLLVRSARGVSLTPAGRAFFARASAVQEELRKAQEELDTLRGSVGGTVALGIAPHLSAVVPQAMARFREKYPVAEVRIVEGVRTALLPRLREESLDFMIAQNPGGPLPPGLRFRPLLRPTLVVVGRKGHPLAKARSLKDLADAQWLVFNPPGAGGVVERAFERAQLPAPRALVHCESYATALGLMAHSDLLGLLFERRFDDPWVERELHRFDLRDEIPAPLLGLFIRAETPLAPAAAAMAQALTSAVRALARRAA